MRILPVAAYRFCRAWRKDTSANAKRLWAVMRSRWASLSRTKEVCPAEYSFSTRGKRAERSCFNALKRGESEMSLKGTTGTGLFNALSGNQVAGFEIIGRFNLQNRLPDPIQIHMIEARCSTFLNSGSPVTMVAVWSKAVATAKQSA